MQHRPVTFEGKILRCLHQASRMVGTYNLLIFGQLLQLIYQEFKKE